MPFYRCLIRGENFPGECVASEGLWGFYTTRWVQALNVRAAELKAVAAMRKDPSFKAPPGAPRSRDARVYVEEIVRIDRLPRFRGRGATWFSDAQDRPARRRRGCAGATWFTRADVEDDKRVLIKPRARRPLARRGSKR